MEEEYEMDFVFDIDDGELYGINSKKAFVLGFELGNTYQLVEQGDLPDLFMIHSENRERVEKLLRQKDLNYKYKDTDDYHYIYFEKDL